MITSPSAAGWRSWMRTHPYTIVAAVAVAAMGVSFCRRSDSEWERVFVQAAVHLRHGQDIYHAADGYLYPPFMALATLPFAALPPAAGRLAWLLVNVLATALLLRCSWRAAGGPRLEGTMAPRAEHAAAVLGTLCGVDYIQNCLAHQQTDLVMGALLVGGCLLWQRARSLAAASCWGLAAAMKCTPLLFAPYLLWRRRPVAAAWLLAVALFANLLPDLVHPGPAGRPWLGVYTQRFLQPLTDANHHVGTWGSEPIYNQSVAGAVHRWFLTRLQWTDSDCLVLRRGDMRNPMALRLAAYGTCLALVCLTAWAAGGAWRELPLSSSAQRAALECSAVVLLMLLLSPMSSMAHFGIVVLPAFCLARIVAAGQRRLAWVVPVGLAFLGLLASKDPLGERLYTLTLWYGSLTLETTLLLIGCLVALRWQPWPAQPAATGELGGSPALRRQAA